MAHDLPAQPRLGIARSLIAATCLIAAPAAATAQPGAAEIGLWLNHTGKGAIETYMCGSSLCGRIVWLKEPNFANGKPKHDGHNPDPAKRKRMVCGLTTLWGLKRAGGGWSDGQAYNPEEGKQYSVSVRLAGNDTLNVTGSVLFFSKTVVWKRIKSQLERCDAVAKPAAPAAAAAPPAPAAPAAVAAPAPKKEPASAASAPPTVKLGAEAAAPQSPADQKPPQKPAQAAVQPLPAAPAPAAAAAVPAGDIPSADKPRAPVPATAATAAPKALVVPQQPDAEPTTAEAPAAVLPQAPSPKKTPPVSDAKKVKPDAGKIKAQAPANSADKPGAAGAAPAAGTSEAVAADPAPKLPKKADAAKAAKKATPQLLGGAPGETVPAPAEAVPLPPVASPARAAKSRASREVADEITRALGGGF